MEKHASFYYEETLLSLSLVDLIIIRAIRSGQEEDGGRR
jgi:hypothetical protein